jgi:hypothetical protein
VFGVKFIGARLETSWLLRPHYLFDPRDVVGDSGVDGGAVGHAANLPEGRDPHQVQSVVADLQRTTGIALNQKISTM